MKQRSLGARRRIPLLWTLLTLFRSLTAGAQTPPLDPEPVWFSGPANNTNSVALGDVDRDGDLDLVCGNLFGSNTLYRNDGLLSESPAWLSSPALRTTAVALGDVDGDGDLDLACGNGNHEPNTVYRNDDGRLCPDPIWYSGLSQVTESIAFADVDRDGDLDLVCGNRSQPNTLYRNDRGSFTSDPVWLSQSTTPTYSVALGDVDGDGHYDLVCGNLGECNTLYFGNGEAFSNVPDWCSGPANFTRSVAIGDMDGDGALDVICGNSNGNTMYRNDSGTLATQSTWFPPPGNTDAIAVGDVDRDGDLDVICGNGRNLMGGLSDTIYRNDGGDLSTNPTWLSSLPTTTSSIAVADIDGDGFLDLMCGTLRSSNTLYLANARVFDTIPDSLTSGLLNPSSMALGDIDGDRDLDLVLGNAGPNLLYRNDGGSMSVAPFWTSGADNDTKAVVLADVDGDGDLDLSCGNAGGIGEANTLYRNDEGTISELPSWISELLNPTCDIALGDVDNDGDLDLACGNADSCNTLYRNDSGVFSPLPVWSSIPRNKTRSVAFGDVDQDGDLDLVCGNEFGGPGGTLYRNDDGALSEEPWWSGPSDATVAIDLGDVDGDGDLDLACGNFNRNNTVYLNNGGVFSSTAAWSSVPLNYTRTVALVDVDGDGDLDLVCGNGRTTEPQTDVVYMNHEGVLSRLPEWSSPLTEETTSVLLGDVDQDGDLDLLATSGATGIMYPGSRNPAVTFNPDEPANHLPNNAAHLRWVSTDSVAVNVRAVELAAIDVEADPVWILADFQYRGIAEWQPIDLVGGGLVGPLMSSRSGTTHSFEWDLSRVPFDDRDIVLRLRTMAHPSKVGTARHVTSYFLDVDHITPSRAQIAVPTERLILPTVTVGDTVSVALPLSNIGNEALTISGLTLPPGLVSPTTVPPVPPSASDSVLILFGPTAPLSIDGLILVRSNDPTSPEDTVAIQGTALDLAVETNALAPGDEAPLGEALTIQVIPAEGVRVEHGSLYYRAVGDAFADSIELVASGGSFIGQIPGTALVESGIEYYVEVENSGIFRTDPPGAPDDSLFFQAVAAPQGVSSTVDANSGNDITSGLDVGIEVQLDDGIEFVDGTLQYRPGGLSVYDSTDFEIDGRLLRAVVPADAVGARGFEYWVRIGTSTTSLYDPPNDPAEFPRSVSVVVPRLVEAPGLVQGGRYRMVSVPLGFGADFTLSDLLGDEAAFGPYDVSTWRSFRYLPSPDAGRYIELGDTEPPKHHALHPGKGYWLISRDPGVIETDPVAGTSTPTSAPYSIVMDPGWNQIGNPFVFPVAWATITQPSSSVDELVEFDPLLGVVGEYLRDPPEILRPFRGYFVHNASSQAETLWVPPIEATELTPRGPFVADGWSERIEAATASGATGSIAMGVHTGSHDNHDELDRLKPPSPPTPWISLAIANHDWGRRSGLYRRDLRSPDSEGHRWELELLSEGAADHVTLIGSLSGADPPEAFRLLDLEQNTSAPFDGGAVYELVAFGPDKPYRLALVAGTEDYVADGASDIERPVALSLDRSAPNPFRGATRIRFGLPAPQRVTLAIYNLEGRRVASLVDSQVLPAGYHVEIWDGRDDRGRRVASGVFFYRLQTETGAMSKRMVVLR